MSAPLEGDCDFGYVGSFPAARSASESVRRSKAIAIHLAQRAHRAQPRVKKGAE